MTWKVRVSSAPSSFEFARFPLACQVRHCNKYSIEAQKEMNALPRPPCTRLVLVDFLRVLWRTETNAPENWSRAAIRSAVPLAQVTWDSPVHICAYILDYSDTFWSPGGNGGLTRTSGYAPHLYSFFYCSCWPTHFIIGFTNSLGDWIQAPLFRRSSFFLTDALSGRIGHSGWLPRMRKVASPIPGEDCTYLCFTGLLRVYCPVLARRQWMDYRCQVRCVIHRLLRGVATPEGLYSRAKIKGLRDSFSRGENGLSKTKQ